MSASILISGTALLVSIIVFVDNRLRQIRAARLERQPALVFVWNEPKEQWILSNIGNGPGLDVVMIQRIDGRWQHPLRMPELAVEGKDVVPRRWVEAWHRDPGLGVRYKSITGEPYWTWTRNDWSEIYRGWTDLPDALWEAIEPHWQYRGSSVTRAE